VTQLREIRRTAPRSGTLARPQCHLREDSIGLYVSDDMMGGEGEASEEIRGNALIRSTRRRALDGDANLRLKHHFSELYSHDTIVPSGFS